MIISIREANAWENERWTYCLDISKQHSAALNWLMIFVKLANEQYELIKRNAPTTSFGGPFARPMKIFAACYYLIRFYDSLEKETSDTLIFKEGKTSCHIRKTGDYTSPGNCLNEVISVARMKSAAIAMRDKKENKLYKNFDSLFLKRKEGVPA